MGSWLGLPICGRPGTGVQCLLPSFLHASLPFTDTQQDLLHPDNPKRLGSTGRDRRALRMPLKYHVVAQRANQWT